MHNMESQHSEAEAEGSLRLEARMAIMLSSKRDWDAQWDLF